MDTALLVDIVSTVVLALTFLVLAFQASLLRKQIREEHEWRRRQNAVQASAIRNQSIQDARRRINDVFGYLGSKDTPIPLEEFDRAFEKNPSLKDDVYYFLAYLENIGLATLHNVASLEVIYEAMGNTYINYAFVFKNYMNRDRKYNPRLWEYIELLAHELNKVHFRRNPPPPTSTKLG